MTLKSFQNLNNVNFPFSFPHIIVKAITPRDKNDGHIFAYPIGFLMPIHFSVFGGVDDVMYTDSVMR